MKFSIIFLLMTLPITIFAQLLDREEDLSGKGFSTKDFLDLDTDFAIQLAEQKAKTLIMSIANKAAASAPFVGSVGVAAELGLSNLKFDEMLVADKQYNYKLTAVLGNILKVTKETRDGTYKSRGINAAKKIKIVDQSIKAVKKCNRTKNALLELKKKGWNTTTMTRAIKALDASLTALEEVGETMLAAYNSYDGEKEAIDNAQKTLDDVNTMMNSAYSGAIDELNRNISDRYNYEYNSSLLTGAFYCQDLTKAEAREKVRENLQKSSNALIIFKRIMWSICLIFFLIAATGFLWKTYFITYDSNLIIKYYTVWIVSFFLTAVLGGILEQVIYTIEK